MQEMCFFGAGKIRALLLRRGPGDSSSAIGLGAVVGALLARFSFLAVCLCLAGCHSSQSSCLAIALPEEPAPPPQPAESTVQLVVWLTVDQLRADYLSKYQHHFGPGGLRRLLDHGIFFDNAHYRHAITETAPGHATLFTGASPREHGIIANSWLSDDGTEIVSVFDPSAPLLGPGAPTGMSTEDQARTGRSPRRLLLPTIADSITSSTRGQGKVYSVSAKDRGAILPGGQSGKAYWLGPKGFVSSRFYHDEPPPWLLEAHRALPPVSYLKNGWQLLLAEEEYANPPASSSFVEETMGAGFPHQIPVDARTIATLKNTPFADQAVLDLARVIVKGQELGRDRMVDLLSLSLSSTDYIGHVFGPESREMEDQLVRLDRALEDFFSFLDGQLDSERILFVLSADHGGCESVAYLQSLGLPGQRLTEAAIALGVTEALIKRYGHDRFFGNVVSPYVYLKRGVIEQEGGNLQQVLQVAEAAVERLPGVWGGIIVDDSTKPGEEISAMVSLSTHPGRSGDIYIVPQPYTLLLQDEEIAATHGSPWSYDTHVPVVIARRGMRMMQSNELVDVRSLAPTVARLISVPAPAGARAPLLPGAL